MERAREALQKAMGKLKAEALSQVEALGLPEKQETALKRNLSTVIGKAHDTLRNECLHVPR